jgi:ABC-type transport system substrate-binding protein
VRQALNHAFDFEGANKAIYFDLYFRNNSYFAGTELAATGLPAGKELDILKEVDAKFPDGITDDVFTMEHSNPVGGSDEAVRANLREAVRLFKEAGYEIRDGKMVNEATGEQFTIEFLYYEADADRQVQFWRTNLEKIGVGFSIRVVETSAYIERLRNFDYDAIISVCRPATSSANSGAARRLRARVRATMPASPTRRWMRSSTSSFSHPTGKRWSPRPRRSTACCCRRITSFRSSITRSPGSPIGTDSAIRTRCRNMMSGFRPSGGSTRRRPPAS